MYSYIFRVDAGNIPELGTGHIFRCIEIYKYLLNKGIKKNKILFICKTLNKYSSCKDILKKNRVNFISISSRIEDFSLEELNFLNKIKSNVIIFDRLSEIKTEFIKKLKINHKKIIGIDVLKKKYVQIDYFINPLNNRFNGIKKLKNFKNNILPSFNIKKKRIINNKKIKKVFVFFGGYDYKNLKNKILKLNIPNTKYVFPKKKYFYTQMQNSDIVLCSGGLTIFDAIYNNKIIVSIPQYNHQLINLKILNHYGVISLFNNHKKAFKNLKTIIQESIKLSYKKKNLIHKKQKKIISWKSQKEILEKIYKLNA